MKMYYPDSLWLGTDQELIWFDTKSWHYGMVRNITTSPQDVIRLNTLAPERKDGNAWMLLQLSGSVAHYNVHSRTFQFMDENSDPVLPFTLVKHIAYDAYGDVWIGGHALTRWNHQSMRFDTTMRLYGGTKNYNTDILTMVADSAGSLWLHNAENGLLQYNITDRVFRQFSMKDGLPSNTIIGLSPVIEGILFMSMPHHLIRMDTKNYGIEVFANEADLPEEISSGRSMYWHEESKRMYAFYRNAIIRFPLVRPRSNFEGNDIIVQELEINDKHKLYYPADNVNLESRENNLSIYYTIIDFEQSNDYQFAYNFDDSKDWTNVASQRVVHLTDLTSGNHQLQIKATGKSGKQKVSIFHFSIKRPFWKQAWFISLIALLFSGIIYLIFRTRESRIRQKANLDRQIAVAEMKALHAQMNPHFIFNSLNSIKEMVLQNDAKDASRYLSDFAHLIRMTLDHSRQTFVSLRSTMEYLTAYVKMEQIRKSNFDFQMDADPALDPDETLIPPMLIQPFIENAIWHGVNGNKNHINIRVKFKRLDGHLLCTIEDNGIGIDKSKEKKNGSNTAHHSVGIDNIQTRIDLLNQKHHFKSKIEITDKHVPGNGTMTGTIVKITLPLEIQEQT
jgi:two-component sensor histidine kinase